MNDEQIIEKIDLVLKHIKEDKIFDAIQQLFELKLAIRIKTIEEENNGKIS